MSLDTVLSVLRRSGENEERKQAVAQLRQLQESDPVHFLKYTAEGIACSALETSERFFLAAAVGEFVEQSWRNTVPKDVQLQVINRYVQLIVSETFSSLALVRKIAYVLGLMVSRSGAKAGPGALPAPMESALVCLVDATVRAVASFEPSSSFSSLDHVTQLLLALHEFLKFGQQKRVGGVFLKLCTFLVPTMSTLFASTASWDFFNCYLSFLYLFKCALRVFGYGVFEPDFYVFLQNTAWKLSESLCTSENETKLPCYRRLLEYALKVQLVMVKVFPSRLAELSLSFFVTQGTTMARNISLFDLLVSIIEYPNRERTSEKMVCRAMHIFSVLLGLDESNHIKECFTVLANTPLLQRLIERIITLLSDETSEERLRGWHMDPELYVAELDSDITDEENLQSCTEELLVGLTISTVCSTRSLEVAWQVVNMFLISGDIAKITAALHAIGTCYYTMSNGTDTTNYISFLKGKLLPLIETAAQTSPFILRRVVWVIGMWCESVKDPVIRNEVYTALASLFHPNTSIVVLLTALRAFGSFIDDPNFTHAEITPELVCNVILTIQHILPLLHSSCVVKSIICLVHSMIQREILTTDSGELLDIVLPAVYTHVSGLQATLRDNINLEREGDNDKLEMEESDSKFDMSSLGVLLECVASCVRVATKELQDRLWSLFQTVVVPCTIPGGVLTPWAEGEAWDLLLSMSRAAYTWNTIMEDALAWCFKTITCETTTLDVEMRCAYTLLLLCPTLEKFTPANVVEYVLLLLTQTNSSTVSSSCFALLAVIVCRGGEMMRYPILVAALKHLLSLKSVQSEMYSVSLALLLTWSLLPHADNHNNDGAALFAQTVWQHPNGASLVEYIVLLVDVSPSRFVTEQLLTLLRWLQQRLPELLHEKDAKMVQHTMEGALVDWEDGIERVVARNPSEMLLELFGDENTHCSSPHLSRLTSLFNINVSALAAATP